MGIFDFLIIGVVIYFVFFRGKKAKKVEKHPRPVASPSREPQVPKREEVVLPLDAEEEMDDEFIPIATVAEGKSGEMLESYPQNDKFSSQSAVYYNQAETSTREESYENESVENLNQPLDNENENNSVLAFDSEEMKKGIIYAEILKRPYN